MFFLKIFEIERFCHGEPSEGAGPGVTIPRPLSKFNTHPRLVSVHLNLRWPLVRVGAKSRLSYQKNTGDYEQSNSLKINVFSFQQVTNPPIDPIREKIVMSLVRGQLCYLRSFLNLTAFLFIGTGSLILLFVSRHVLLGQNRIFLSLMWPIVIVCT